MPTALKFCPHCDEVTPHNTVEPERDGLQPSVLEWVCTQCGRNNGA
jgi:hypothetical protein